MKEIVLSNGMVTLVDDDDFDRVNKTNWYYHKQCGIAYNSKRDKLHRYVLGVNDPKVFVDHINHNKLDNRKENLRICSKQQNNSNKLKQDGKTSPYKGVHLEAKSAKWISQITFNYENIFLGRYDSEIQAAIAYNNAAVKYFGEFALLNNIPPEAEDRVICRISKINKVSIPIYMMDALGLEPWDYVRVTLENDKITLVRHDMTENMQSISSNSTLTLTTNGGIL